MAKTKIKKVIGITMTYSVETGLWDWEFHVHDNKFEAYYVESDKSNSIVHFHTALKHAKKVAAILGFSCVEVIDVIVEIKDAGEPV